MQSFIFGKGTPWTYDQLQRKRKIADKLREGMSGTPRNVGEGLNAIGDALMIRGIDRKADKRDGELKSESDAKWASFGGSFGGGGGSASYGGGGSPGGYAAAPPMAPVDPSNPEAIASDAMTALGKGSSAEGIKSGLVARGMPDHIADAFVMNFRDESNLDPGINEAAPTVPGSRGGFGLAQWTGPRRKALEAFAAEKGMPVDDVNIQLDFLMTELQGSESGAWSKISGAASSGDAAAAIVNSFLRPAESHRARREAEYLGGASSGGGSASGGGDIGAGGMGMMQLAELAADPYADPGKKAVVEALMAQQMQAMDPMQQMQMEKMRLELDQMKNPNADPMAAIELEQAQLNLEQDQAGAAAADLPSGALELQYRAEAAGLVPGTPEYQSFMLNAGGDPATYRALEMQAVAAGLVPGTPEFQSFMATRGAGVAEYAKITQGNIADAETGGAAELARADGRTQGAADVTSRAELAEMQRNMPGLMTVVGQLDALADRATYTMGGQALDFGKKQLGMDPGDGAIARAEYIATVDNQVLPLLRQTFGAAFTAKEGDTLRATLGDPDKSPAEKKAVLRAFIAQKKRDLEARGGTVPGTGGGDFAQMGIAEIGQVDIGSLTPDQMDALEARMKELGL